MSHAPPWEAPVQLVLLDAKTSAGQVPEVPVQVSATSHWPAEARHSNPDAWIAEGMYGFTASGLFGYSHIYGGYAGGQAEYARVPFADIGPIKIPAGLADEQVLFLSDIFPTGYMAAENCDIQPGDTIAIWGCGPVGQFAIKSAYMLGAERVIAIDYVPERLRMAQQQGRAESHEEF